jgi:hypothetical protein
MSIDLLRPADVHRKLIVVKGSNLILGHQEPLAKQIPNACDPRSFRRELMRRFPLQDAPSTSCAR